MGILDPEAEAIERDILATWAKELNSEQLKQFPVGQALIEEGIEEGVTRNSLEIAKKMLSDGISVEQTAKLTGLSLKVVKEIEV